MTAMIMALAIQEDITSGLRWLFRKWSEMKPDRGGAMR